jgi:hypothetical protein
VSDSWSPPEPECDADGYPLEACLTALERWPFNYPGAIHYAAHLVELTGYGTIGWHGTGVRIATGGWSGCEDVIAALGQNPVVWGRYWESSHRGGLHVFQLGSPADDGRAGGTHG